MDLKEYKTAIFANGCFWCSEAIFQKIKGIKSVKSGYIGGNTKNPTYKEVCTGLTNHAEAIEIKFDPEVISYKELLEVFFATHDPTTLNRQGNDIGTQYRSEIFYMDQTQKAEAEEFLSFITNENIFDKPVVTKVSQASTFYFAENYHENYFNNHPENSYCAVVINPKIKKFEKYFDRIIQK